jgi:hypothetical protein
MTIRFPQFAGVRARLLLVATIKPFANQLASLRYASAEHDPRMSSKRTTRGWPRPPH